MSTTLPANVDDPNGPVGYIVPAPDEAEANSWASQLLSKGREAVEAWNARMAEYKDMMATRGRWGVPLYDDAWSKQDDDNFWNMDLIVRTFSDRLDDVAKARRSVGYFNILDTIGALGHAGEQYITVTKDGGLWMSSSPNPVPRDAFGTVGEGVPVPPPNVIIPIVGVVVIVVSIAVAVAIWQICTYLNNRISSAAASDIQKHTEELRKAGYTPEQIAAQLKAEEDLLKSQKIDPNQSLYDALKVGAVVVAILGVVGASVWAAKTYLPGRKSNPAGKVHALMLTTGGAEEVVSVYEKGPLFVYKLPIYSFNDTDKQIGWQYVVTEKVTGRGLHVASLGKLNDAKFFVQALLEYEPAVSDALKDAKAGRFGPDSRALSHLNDLVLSIKSDLKSAKVR